MSVREFAMRASIPDEITSNPEWYTLAQRATEFLSEEVRDSGVVIPALLVDWTLQSRAPDAPMFEVKLSDVPDGPQPPRAKFSLDEMRQEETVRQSLYRLWRQLLQQRSRRLAESIGMFIKGQAEE